jgi:hypothetical protein
MDMRPEIRPDPDQVADARAAVAEMGDRLDLVRRLEPFASLCWDGSDPGGHTLYLDDFSEIPFLDEITAVEEYMHRSRVRSGDGDVFVTLTAATDGYEDY